MAISVDRFYAVWFPLKAARTKPRMKCVISLVWLTSALIHLPYLYAFNIVTVSGDKTYCFVGWPRPVTKVVFLLLIFLILIIPLGIITALYSFIVKKIRSQTLYGVRNLAVCFTREKRNRNILDMSLAIVAIFFFTMSPFVVFLTIDIFSDGRACLSKNFRFVSQYLVHCNGVLHFFTYFTFNRSYRRGFTAILSRAFCLCCSWCPWKHEEQLSSHYRFDRRGLSAVKFEMNFESRDVVLTSMRSLNSDRTAVANGSIDRNIINP